MSFSTRCRVISSGSLLRQGDMQWLILDIIRMQLEHSSRAVKSNPERVLALTASCAIVSRTTKKIKM